MKDEIRALADRYAAELKSSIDERVAEMEHDERSHALIYCVLGVTEDEGKSIDVYQNKGRLLYNSAGRFLEAAAMLCFKSKFRESGPFHVSNNPGKKPKNFQIDCLVGKDALEIKWRDATTDGDHINKEHARIRAISEAGFKPVRVMFFYPNREQAKDSSKRSKPYTRASKASITTLMPRGLTSRSAPAWTCLAS